MSAITPVPLSSAAAGGLMLSKCGTGVILFLDLEARRLVAVPTMCHRWDCDTCAGRRLSKARAQAAAGKPERLITLTTRPREGLSTLTAIKWLRGRWTALLRRLRRNYPRLEYMAFLELHKSGWPHLHVLTRGCYIPQRVLSAWWQDLTGSFKVHIQKIDRTWQGVNECTKYILKTARQVHAASASLPVYTMSKRWLPKDWNDGERPAGNFVFYCYCPLSWPNCEGILEQLGVDIAPIADSPGKYALSRAGPEFPAVAQSIYEMGSYGETALVSALELFFSNPAAAFNDPALLCDKRDFAARPDLPSDVVTGHDRVPFANTA